MTGKRIGHGVVQAAAVVVAASVIGKLLAFGREITIARYFGTSGEVDAYLIAYILPVFIANVVGLALSTVLIPVMTEYFGEGKREEFQHLVNLILTTVSVFCIGLSLLLIICAPVIIRILGPGFVGEQRTLAINLLRVMAPGLWLFVIGYVYTAALNTQRRFLVGALRPAILNGITILGTLILYGKFSIMGLALATVLGGIVQLFFLVIDLSLSGFRFQTIFDWSNPVLRKIIALIGPVFVITAVFQINVMVDRMIASSLPEGSIAALNYAYRLMYLPQGLVVAGIITALFPSISEYAFQNDVSGLKKMVSSGMDVIIFITVPAATGLMVLGQPIVELLFQRGAFNSAATIATSRALFFYSIGIIAYSFNDLLSRVFFAVQDTKTPMKIGFFVAGLNIILNLILSRIMQYAGLALATSISGSMQAVLGIYLLRKRVGGIGGRVLARNATCVLVASAMMGCTASGLYRYMAELDWVAGGIGRMLGLIGLISLSALVYFGITYLMGVKNVCQILSWIKAGKKV